MQYDSKDDAYRYDASGRSIAGLEIIINLDNVDPDLLKNVIDCLQRGISFILHNDDALILFDPIHLHGIEKPANARVYYVDRTQFLNGVKLALLAYTNLIVLSVGIGKPTERKTIKKPPKKAEE